jgi:nitrogen-specific signal transduction histidine kinase
MPSMKLNAKKPEGELTNIYTITDLCISTNSISSNIEFTKSYDPTIPDIIIDSNILIKLLNKAYHCFYENKTIDTKVFLRIGEHVRFEEKKFSIFSIEISAENLNTAKTNEVKNFAQSNGFYIEIGKRNITFNIPMITA